MQIKRFEATDTRTALQLVKKEMGEEAVILSTRTVRAVPGKKRGHMEVVAAMDYDLDESVGEAKINPVTFKLPQNSSTIFPQLTNKSTKPVMITEAQQLQARFNKLYNNNSSLPENAPVPGQTIQRNKPSRQDIEKWRRKLISQLQVIPLSVSKGKGPQIIAMVGTTGSGKTTTAAKLAAWFSIRKGLKVTLLSLDCYRIGATEQLRTYARIMRLPCEIILREEDLDRTLAKHATQDLIIIDTAGRSPYDSKHLREMTNLFNARPNIKPYLVVNATAKKEDLKHICKAYKGLSPVGQIVTKLDETRAYATLCQHLATSGMQVSGLCTGQRVPEDYIPADRGYISTLFNKGWNAATGYVIQPNVESWMAS